MNKHIIFILLVFVAVLYIPEEASAYLDSGSAGMILQMAVGAVVGFLIFIKMNWLKLKGFAKKVLK